VADVENDAAWGETYDWLGAPYWRDYAEAAWAGRWNGLVVRGAEAVEQAATCVFPSDAIVASLEPRTFLFSEHPIAFEDDVAGFVPLARETFEAMKGRGVNFYNAHAPLDQRPEVSPSRLSAEALRLERWEKFFPIADGIPGGAVVIGNRELELDELAGRLRAFLGDEIPVVVLSRPRREAGRVAIAAGGGGDRAILEASLKRGCQTFVTGNAASECRIDFVQKGLRAFRELADAEGVGLVDGTHYGTEKPLQLAMAEWFRRRGLAAECVPGRPERS
jgi:putative NIF3 family GTP cyclohydrolase 1 type 2